MMCSSLHVAVQSEELTAGQQEIKCRANVNKRRTVRARARVYMRVCERAGYLADAHCVSTERASRRPLSRDGGQTRGVGHIPTRPSEIVVDGAENVAHA